LATIPLFAALTWAATASAGDTLIGSKHPGFAGSTATVGAFREADLKGKVLIVHFFAHRCHNCQANDDAYTAWHRELAKKDVVVLGIHTPELSSVHDVDDLKAELKRRKIEYPVLVDNDRKLWKGWKLRAWPTVLVIDRDGVVTDGWEGELRWRGAKGVEKIRASVDAALAKPAANTASKPDRPDRDPTRRP
jgi:peroxiredoxin